METEFTEQINIFIFRYNIIYHWYYVIWLASIYLSIYLSIYPNAGWKVHKQ